MLVTPFMSCSARLPIYILFSGMFFPNDAMIVAYSMYLIGIVVALVALKAMNVFSHVKKENDLLIELPEYKRPSAHTVYIYVWEKIKDYLSRAGTVIFAASILMWFILNFGPAGYGDMADSFGAIIGKAIVPFFAPSAWGTGRFVWPSWPVFPPRKSSFPVLPSSSMASTSIRRRPGSPGVHDEPRRVHPAQCLLHDALLPALYPLRRDDRHDPR